MPVRAALPSGAQCAVNDLALPPKPPPCGSVFGSDCQKCQFAPTRFVQARSEVFSIAQTEPVAWFVHSGLVKLVVYDNSGREFLLDLLGPGDLLGAEVCFGEAYASTAIALVDTEVCGVRCDPKALTPPQLAYVAKNLQTQLARARRHQQSLGSFRARDKLVRHLIDHLEFDGTAPFYPQRLSLRDMANMVGISAETVCRVLADLERDGIVAADRGKIRILSIRKLRVDGG